MIEITEYRLNKYIAHCGICSRRKAGDLVKEGKVKVNGKTETNPAIMVTQNDTIEYKGKIIKIVDKMYYYLMNKPKNTITTMNDEHGRKTVYDIIKTKVKTRVFPVGRLDRATTGLLILTNDGDLTQRLAHPKFNIKKLYHVKLDRDVSSDDLKKIANGLELEDGLAIVDKIEYVKDKPQNEIVIEIHIGKNRIIRRIFEHLDYKVKYLDRVYYAGLTKKDLPRGWVRDLTKQEVIMLKHFNLGKQ